LACGDDLMANLDQEDGSTSPERASRRPVVAVIVDRVDWHARELIRAFGAHDADAVPLRLETCGFDTERRSGLSIPGFEDTLPDSVLVRSMSGGTFQAVTLRLGVLHALGRSGVPMMNEAPAIERCVDKSMTSFLLARAGIATPASWATESLEQAREIVGRESAMGPLVLKPLFGSQGRGLRLIRSTQDLPDPAAVTGVYYLQRYVGVERDGFRDFRLLVSRRRVIAAMVRHADHWITNIKQGGRPIAAVVDAELKRLAIAAADAVGAVFAGVDIIHDEEGRATVLEVNSMPAWSGLQRVTPGSIASLLADDLLERLAPCARHGAAV
jgi:RimK family alpha-L-glutamate ligase